MIGKQLCGKKLSNLVKFEFNIFFYYLRSLRVWSLKTYEILEILRGHEDEIEVKF